MRLRDLARAGALGGAPLLLTACSLAFSGGRYTGGDEVDAAGVDAPGLDAPGLDASGLDAPLPDAPGVDAPPDAFDACATVSCGADETCFEGACFRTCTAMAECMAGEECTVDGRCVPTTPCATDAECDAGTYCDGTRCVSCDFDRDGFASTTAPAARCVTSMVREGDCDDTAPGVHPWGLPDCERDTTETCGTGSGLFAPENFEAGRMYLRDVLPMAGLRDVHVLPLSDTGRDVRTMVVFRTETDLEPQWVIVSAHPDGTFDVTRAERIPGWRYGERTLASRMTAGRDPMGRMLVTSLEVVEQLGVRELWHWGARFDGTEWRAPVISLYRNSISVVADPMDVSAIAMGFADTSTFVFANTTHGDGEHLLLYGLELGHREEASGVPSGPTFSRGLSGGAGGAMVGRFSESGLVLWSGRVGTEQSFTLVDTMSSSPAAFGSGLDGDTQVVSAVIAPGPLDSAHVTVVRCEPRMPCTQAHELVPFVSLGMIDPRLSADHLAGSAFMTVGVQRGGVPFFAALDAGRSPMTFSALPIPEATDGADWTATEVGTLVVPLAGARGSATAAMAGVRDGGMDLTVLRSCLTF